MRRGASSNSNKMIIEDDGEYLPDKKSFIKKQYELDDLFDDRCNEQSDLVDDASDASDNSFTGKSMFKQRKKRGPKIPNKEKGKGKGDKDILDLFFN